MQAFFPSFSLFFRGNTISRNSRADTEAHPSLSALLCAYIFRPLEKCSTASPTALIALPAAAWTDFFFRCRIITAPYVAAAATPRPTAGNTALFIGFMFIPPSALVCPEAGTVSLEIFSCLYPIPGTPDSGRCQKLQYGWMRLSPAPSAVPIR